MAAARSRRSNTFNKIASFFDSAKVDGFSLTGYKPKLELEDETKAANTPNIARRQKGQRVQAKVDKELKRNKDKKMTRKAKSDKSQEKCIKKHPLRPQTSNQRSAKGLSFSASDHYVADEVEITEHIKEEAISLINVQQSYAEKKTTKKYPLRKGSFVGFTCPVCNLEFKFKSIGKIHEATHKKVSEDDKAHKCKFCNYKSNYKCNVCQHENEKHGTQRHVCALCGKSYKGLGNFKQHRLTHDTVVEYSCEFCSNKFKSKSSLRRHLMTFHDVKEVCQVCQKKFYSHRALSIHQRDYHTMAVNFSKVRTSDLKISKVCPVLDCDFQAFNMPDVMLHVTNYHDLN